MRVQPGRLIGIARRPRRLAPMEELASGRVTLAGGLEGDHKGPKFAKRQITILAVEAWREALDELPQAAAGLNWTTRRANFLVEGVRLPRARGGVIRIGPAEFEVWYPTMPCARMDKAFEGLRKALHPEWRGGVACSVRCGGEIRIGDDVEVLISPPERPKVPFRLH